MGHQEILFELGLILASITKSQLVAFGVLGCVSICRILLECDWFSPLFICKRMSLVF